MTMPHLMNCDHSEDWCLDCVKKLHDEKTELSKALSELLTSCQELVVAMHAYEWVVDTPPPLKHRAMMSRAEKAIHIARALE